MPWSPDNYKRTLFVENLGSTKQPKYALGGFMRVTKPSGETYMEPLPYDWFWKQFQFEQIEHIAPQGTQRSDKANELTLIRRSASGTRYGGREG